MIKMLLILGLFNSIFNNSNNELVNHDYLDNQISLSLIDFKSDYEDFQSKQYYNGENIHDIANKLNKYLKSTLKDKGEFIVEYSMEVALLCRMRKCLIWMLYIKKLLFLKLKFYYIGDMYDIETILQEHVREFDETVFTKY